MPELLEAKSEQVVSDESLLLNLGHDMVKTKKHQAGEMFICYLTSETVIRVYITSLSN